jgi:hypothetical protein
MSEMTLFQNNPLASSDLFKSLQDMNKNISGGVVVARPKRSASVADVSALWKASSKFRLAKTAI